MRTDYFDIIESEILNEEKELDIFLENKSQNLDDLNSLIERREILKKLTQLIQSNFNDNNYHNDINNLQSENIININYDNYINKSNINSNANSFIEENTGGLQFISGIILSENEMKLRRTVFRVSYGLGLTTFWQINPSEFEIIHKNTLNPNLSLIAPKKIFTIFLKNSDPENNYLFGKLIKICDALGATRYNIPRSHALSGLLAEIEADIIKRKKVLEEQINSIRGLIIDKTGTPVNPSTYALYRVFFKKQKEIYLNLSKCKSSNSFYDGEIWVLNKKLNEIKHAIGALAQNSANHHGSKIEDMPVNSADAPPTFLDCNEFLWPFQEIVNTYGIPRYQEINPTVFNIVTFPFLFGVMFGDIGHGLILLLFAIYICVYAEEIKNNKNSIIKPLLPGRYLLLFMGFFAFYCGWIYNEFFSIALPFLGGSCYNGIRAYKNNVNEYFRKDRECVYKFGMDPKWQMSQNEISFHNSVKMKLSVILGVFHMLFGIVLKGINCIHFKNKLALIFEFIPQLIFMLVLFGYMDVMIIVKWLRNWDNNEANAPSLISQLMNIFLNPGNVVSFF
jgi:V-type H+-transporting ATPase subunit a